jgi:hypothetical protein
MPKFTFIAEHDSGQKVTYECEHDFIDHVLEDFDLFLRGVGFFPQGDRLEYVSDEQYYDDQPEWQTPEWDTPQDFSGDGHDGMGSTMADYPYLYDEADLPKTKSQYYFDTERNK